MQPLRMFDIDPETLSEGLRELADGIDSGEVAVETAKTSHDADSGDATVLSLRLYYMTGNTDLTPDNFIEYSEQEVEDGD